MYRGYVRRRIRTIFDGLSRSDYAPAVSGMADDVHHVFAGDHALGGERRSKDAVRRWFERVFRLYELSFDVERVIVSGPPWDILVAVEWLGHATPRAGAPYENEGLHVIRIRGGRVVYFHAYEDSQKVADACRVMADAGIEEAAAAPIVD